MQIERIAAGSLDVLAAQETLRVSFEGGELSVEEELARPWSRVWALREDDGLLSGLLIAWHVADELHILNVAVHPSRRRRGLASRLIRHGLDYARDQKIRILVLEVRRSNRAAIGLYRAHGFSVLGVRKKYYGDNDEDAIEMMLGLDPATGAPLPLKDEIDIDSLG